MANGVACVIPLFSQQLGKGMLDAACLIRLWQCLEPSCTTSPSSASAQAPRDAKEFFSERTACTKTTKPKHKALSNSVNFHSFTSQLSQAEKPSHSLINGLCRCFENQTSEFLKKLPFITTCSGYSQVSVLFRTETVQIISLLWCSWLQEG